MDAGDDMTKRSTTGVQKRNEAYRICCNLARNHMWHQCDLISQRMDRTPWPFSDKQRDRIKELKRGPQVTYGGYWLDKEKRDQSGGA